MLSVGMVAVDDGVIKLGQAFDSLVHPGGRGAAAALASVSGSRAETSQPRTARHLAVEGIEAHHLRPLDVDAAPSLSEVLPRVLGLLTQRDGMLVHHAALDIGVLERACRETGRSWPQLPVVDTARIIARANRRRAVAGLPRLPEDLAGARAALGLPDHPAHDALNDAIATAELYLALTPRNP
jgi:DNA polymerase-3 subunit epsilon